MQGHSEDIQNAQQTSLHVSQIPHSGQAVRAEQKNAQVSSWVLDFLLGVTVTLVIALVITANQGGTQGPDAIAYLFACAFGALMLARRHFPVAVLVATMFLLFAYYTLGYPAIGLAVPVAAALYSAAELGHLSASVLVSIVLLVVSTYFRLEEGETVAYLLGYELVSTVGLMAAAIALGDNARARRALTAQQEQTARLIAQEQSYRAEQRIQAERVRIAHDLHDTLGHAISVISLHANVAEEAIGESDEDARQAVTHIRQAASQTMRELRATLKVLRYPTDEPRLYSMASLSNLADLVQSVEAGGIAVDVEVAGDLTELPAMVDAVAYRIVQESLTNMIRHARGATHASLAITVDATELRLQLTDNGLAEHEPITPGSGITGMTERIQLLGGQLTAGPQAVGGFRVFATLPLEKQV